MHPDLFDGETPIVRVSVPNEQSATEPRRVRAGINDPRKRDRREETLK